jgi:enamine deaminase RidA (YjgF/YER057c/UK114 family)
MGSRPLYRVVAALLIVAVCAWAQERKRKKKKGEEEEITQTLEVLKDPPNVVTAETRRLVFHVANPTSKGLLSQQMRDALRDIFRQARGAAPVKLRAFVAGTGDLRRVQAIVSETFTERRMALPALSVVQIGELIQEGAQLALEAISVTRKPVHSYGLAFISGQGASSSKPLDPIRPLAEKTLANLETAVRAIGSEPSDVLRVTCFATALDEAIELRTRFRTAFPKAAVNYMQVQRAPAYTLVECEAVASLRKQPSSPLEMINPEGLTKSPNFSQIAVVGAPRVAISGTQLAFRFQDADVRLAFQRLSKSMEETKASLKNVAFSHIYPLTNPIMEKVRAIRFDYYDKARPPASTMILFEGLPSLDASFGVDVIAVLPQ